MIEKLLNFHTVDFLDLGSCNSFFSVDQPDPAGTGGGSNTGNKAKDFFHPKNREALKKCLDVSSFESSKMSSCSFEYYLQKIATFKMYLCSPFLAWK